MAWLVLLLLPLIVSLALCRLLIAVSVRDGPDGERKLQAEAVPTAGGLAILAAIGVTLLAVAVLTGAEPLDIARGLVTDQPYGGWVLLVLGFGLLGALDDWIGLPALAKLAVLAGASLAMATQMPEVDLALPLAGPVTVPPAAMSAGLALWILAFTNAANFMDGADGLAPGGLAIMLAGLAIGLGSVFLPMLEFLDTRTWAVLLTPVVAIMAIAGFLVWNLSGRLYMGDTGALALGGLFAVLAAYTAAHLGIWYPLVLALPFLVDVGLTLAYRALRRQPLLRAHRDHSYQLFIRRGASPVRVAMLWWAVGLACLAGAVSILGRGPEDTAYGAVLFTGLAGLGALLWIGQRIAYRTRPQPRQDTPLQLTPERPAKTGDTAAGVQPAE